MPRSMLDTNNCETYSHKPGRSLKSRILYIKKINIHVHPFHWLLIYIQTRVNTSNIIWSDILNKCIIWQLFIFSLYWRIFWHILCFISSTRLEPSHSLLIPCVFKTLVENGHMLHRVDFILFFLFQKEGVKANFTIHIFISVYRDSDGRQMMLKWSW